MIQDIVFKLVKVFPEHQWDVEEVDTHWEYLIFVNNYEFYMKDKKFRKILEILRKKYPDVKFICAYKKFSYQ